MLARRPFAKNSYLLFTIALLVVSLGAVPSRLARAVRVAPLGAAEGTVTSGSGDSRELVGDVTGSLTLQPVSTEGSMARTAAVVRSM
jgi:hypothetical protein